MRSKASLNSLGQCRKTEINAVAAISAQVSMKNALTRFAELAKDVAAAVAIAKMAKSANSANSQRKTALANAQRATSMSTFASAIVAKTVNS